MNMIKSFQKMENINQTELDEVYRIEQAFINDSAQHNEIVQKYSKNKLEDIAIGKVVETTANMKECMDGNRANAALTEDLNGARDIFNYGVLGKKKKAKGKEGVDPDFVNLHELTFIDFRQNSGWYEVDIQDDLKIWARQESDNQVYVRCDGFLPEVYPETVFKFLNDIKIRKEYDDVLENVEVAENTGDLKKNECVFRYAFPTHMFTNNMDAVIKRKFLHDFPMQGEHFIHMRSAEFNSFPEQEGFERINAEINGFIVTEDFENDGTRYYWLFKTDFKESLSDAVRNQVISRNPRHFHTRLQRYIKEKINDEDLFDLYNFMITPQ